MHLENNDTHPATSESQEALHSEICDSVLFCGMTETQSTPNE